MIKELVQDAVTAGKPLVKMLEEKLFNHHHSLMVREIKKELLPHQIRPDICCRM